MVGLGDVELDRAQHLIHGGVRARFPPVDVDREFVVAGEERVERDSEGGDSGAPGGESSGVVAGGGAGTVAGVEVAGGLGGLADGEDAVGAEDVDPEEGGLKVGVDGVIELDREGPSGEELGGGPAVGPEEPDLADLDLAGAAAGALASASMNGLTMRRRASSARKEPRSATPKSG